MTEDNRRLLKKILKEKGIAVAGAERPQTQSVAAVSSVEESSDFRRFRQMKERLGSLGLGEAYFQVSEAVNGNTIVINGQRFINFSSYNYLAMSGSPVVSEAAKHAIDIHGTSVSASRIASGEKPLHRELEQELAGFLGTEDCIVFVSGYGTNETVIGHLFGPGDLILHDSLIHESIQRGCKLSGATYRPFPHNRFEAVDTILSESRDKYEKVLIVVEGVYSMDGDIPELPEFIEIKKHHKAMLMVDEAHSIGVLGETGRGIGEFFAINRNDVDLWMGTLSKSFASCGGYICANHDVVEYLKYTGPGFVYSVGLSPADSGAALAAVRLLKREPERVRRLHERAGLFLQMAGEHGWDTGNSKDSGVIPLMFRDSADCIKMFRDLYQRNIFALPIIHPVVPENASRIRFFVTADHTEEQIRTTIEAIAESFSQ